jgi:hypothetical protein
MSYITYNHEYQRKLKTTFIGCGGHAQRNIYPTFQYAPVDLVAVCDLDLNRAQGCARQFGARSFYSDHMEMLAREKPDLVFIVTNCDENFRPYLCVSKMDRLARSISVRDNLAGVIMREPK